MKSFIEHLNEAEYDGRKVTLNKPFRSDDKKKKFYVYVKNEKGNIIKLGFGDPNMDIKRDDPGRLAGFRARHQCDTDPGPKWKARYWSCKFWEKGKTVTDLLDSVDICDSILEASRAGKNTHMTHIEDRVIYGGVKGARESILALRSLRDMLAGKVSSSTDVTEKWDGAPAVFAGIDPSDGKFFVAKKGIFNKDPKVYKSEADVRNDTSGDLADKLVTAFNELKDIGINDVIQGDLMFTKGDLEPESIDGEKYITFQPNTLVYAVPSGSDLAKTISKANLGIVWHTTYKGKSFETMTASYGVDISSLKKKSSVWQKDAGLGLKNLSGTVTLTKADTDEVTEQLSKAGKIFQKIKSTTLNELENNPELATKLETFNNTLVRKGERIQSTSKHVNDLIAWFDKRYKKEYDKRKSAKGKENILKKQEEEMKFFSKENRKNLDMMFQLMNAIVDAKLIIINKLDKLKEIDTFIRTKKGFKVTGSEGFVAIDYNTNGAVKLVDRLEFSTNNFSPDVIKGWER
jgi:hypothetical protein